MARPNSRALPVAHTVFSAVARVFALGSLVLSGACTTPVVFKAHAPLDEVRVGDLEVGRVDADGVRVPLAGGWGPITVVGVNAAGDTRTFTVPRDQLDARWVALGVTCGTLGMLTCGAATCCALNPGIATAALTGCSPAGLATAGVFCAQPAPGTIALSTLGTVCGGVGFAPLAWSERTPDVVWLDAPPLPPAKPPVERVPVELERGSPRVPTVKAPGDTPGRPPQLPAVPASPSAPESVPDAGAPGAAVNGVLY